MVPVLMASLGGASLVPHPTRVQTATVLSRTVTDEAGQPIADGAFSPAVVRGFVKDAVANSGPQDANVLLLLNAKVHERWPGIIDEPIVMAQTSAIRISLASPYLLYKTQVAEAIRKMESPTDIAYPTVVRVSVSPTTRWAPDIDRIVLERNGVIVEPLGSMLKPTELVSPLGAKTRVRAGSVFYQPSAFAPGATVRITAVTTVGSNFVANLDEFTLSHIH